MGSADASPERAWLPHPEEQLFLDQLFVFMERFGRPINKVPNLGFKKSESRTDGGGPPSLPTLPPFLPLSLPPMTRGCGAFVYYFFSVLIPFLMGVNALNLFMRPIGFSTVFIF